MSIILFVTIVVIEGLLALTAFIFIKQARRCDLLDSRCLCLKYKWSDDSARVQDIRRSVRCRWRYWLRGTTASELQTSH